jgi:hypothetical protein
MVKVMWKLRLLAKRQLDFQSPVYLHVDTPIGALLRYCIAALPSRNDPRSALRVVACRMLHRTGSGKFRGRLHLVLWSRSQLSLPRATRRVTRSREYIPWHLAWRHHECVLHSTSCGPRHQAPKRKRGKPTMLSSRPHQAKVAGTQAPQCLPAAR